MSVPRVREDKKRRYNCWAGKPQGVEEDVKYCVYEVHEGGRGGMFHQCSRKRGFGPDGLYCKQHSPEAAEKRR